MISGSQQVRIKRQGDVDRTTKGGPRDPGSDKTVQYLDHGDGYMNIQN